MASLSPDGSLGYITYPNVYDGLVIPADQAAAQLVANNCGKLTNIAIIPVDPAFLGVSGGSANPCFTLFALLDSNTSDPAGSTAIPATGRVRLFQISNVGGTPTLTVVASRTFTDLQADPIDVNTGLGLGIAGFNPIGFSPDGKFFAIQYVLAGSSVGSITTVIRVLAVTPDLPVVASYQMTTTTASNPGTWVALPCSLVEEGESNYYIAVTFGNGTTVPNPANPSVVFAVTGCPTTLIVLRFVPCLSSLTPVASANLPATQIGLATWPRTESQVLQANELFNPETKEEKERKEKDACKVTRKVEKKDKCKVTRKVEEKKDKCKVEKKEDKCKEVVKNKSPAFAMIAVTCIVATATSEVNPFIPLPTGEPLTEGCLGQDAAELRLYAFDGNSLILASAVDTNTRGSGGIAFTPDGKYLFVGQRASTPTAFGAAPTILSIFRIPLEQFISSIKAAAAKSVVCKEKCEKKKAPWYCTELVEQKRCSKPVDPCLIPGTDDAPFVPIELLLGTCILGVLDLISLKGALPAFELYAFSDNSQWFIATGISSGGTVFPIQLFKVIRTEGAECLPPLTPRLTNRC